VDPDGHDFNDVVELSVKFSIWVTSIFFSSAPQQIGTEIKISYQPGDPPMQPETKAVVEMAATDAGVGSIGVSSTQEGYPGDGQHSDSSNHYDRPGQKGTSADINVMDGQRVINYNKDQTLMKKVDKFQASLDKQKAHENYGPSRLSKDGKPIPRLTEKQREKAVALQRQHRNHIHVDPPRKKEKR
jgi:hypothetical protein